MFFSELRKICAPAQVASNMTSLSDWSGTYLWSMVQVLSIAGVINYHLFWFMVPLGTHNKFKEEVVALKRAEVSRQSEISQLMTRMKTLESKSK